MAILKLLKQCTIDFKCNKCVCMLAILCCMCLCCNFFLNRIFILFELQSDLSVAKNSKSYAYKHQLNQMTLNKNRCEL